MGLDKKVQRRLFALKPGMVVPIYTDAEQEEGYIGTAELRKFKRRSLPFILDEVAEKDQVVYYKDYWYVTFVDKSSRLPEDKVYPIKRISHVGTSINGKRDKIKRKQKNVVDYSSILPDSLAEDKFIEFNGVQIY